MEEKNQIVRIEIMEMSCLCGLLNEFLSNSTKLLDNLSKTNEISKERYREIYLKYININDMTVRIGSLIDKLIMEDSFDNPEVLLANFLKSKSDIKSVLSKLHSIYVEEDFADVLSELRDEYNALIKYANRTSYEMERRKTLIYSRREENNTTKPTI